MPDPGGRSLGGFANGRSRRDAEAPEHGRSSHVEFPPFDDGPNTVACNGFKLFGLRGGKLLLFGTLDDALRDGVL